MGYVPDVKASSTRQNTYIEISILILTMLDAFIFTVLSSVTSNGKDTAGGHCQKRFRNTFAHKLLKAAHQLPDYWNHPYLCVGMGTTRF